MGTSFFKNKGATMPTGNQSMSARAMGAPAYAARGAAIGAQKDIGAAQAINKAGKFKPLKRSAAYPKGPVL
jgi:hypothetical protein